MGASILSSTSAVVWHPHWEIAVFSSTGTGQTSVPRKPAKQAKKRRKVVQKGASSYLCPWGRGFGVGFMGLGGVAFPVENEGKREGGGEVGGWGG